LTSFAGDEPRRRARAIGFEAYLTKPVDPTELVAALAGLSARRSASS
jgi:CheY-like chemotaxis protein